MCKLIEIIALTVEDAKRIESAGANRIELISALKEGGLTPSYGLIEAVVKAVDIPVNVMIRPHSQSFVYSTEELELMKQDIQIAKQLGANGVVLGVLTLKNEIDEKALQKLLTVCESLDVTFHRAIDETDVLKSMECLSHYPQITTVLSSGGSEQPIEENVAVIKEMMKKRKHLDILLGGGLTLENVEAIQEQTGADCFHFGTAVREGLAIDEEKISVVCGRIK